MARRALILVEGTRGNGLPYVQEARRLGLHSIFLSADSTRYDYLATERIEAIRVDTNNLDALNLRMFSATSTGITSAKESFCDSWQGLPTFDLPSHEAIEQCWTNSLNVSFSQGRHSNTGLKICSECDGSKSFAAEIDLQPAVGSGSSGVRLSGNSDEIAEHMAYLLAGRACGNPRRGYWSKNAHKAPLLGRHNGVCAAATHARTRSKCLRISGLLVSSGTYGIGRRPKIDRFAVFERNINAKGRIGEDGAYLPIILDR